jgi:hypothetical protein
MWISGRQVTSLPFRIQEISHEPAGAGEDGIIPTFLFRANSDAGIGWQLLEAEGDTDSSKPGVNCKQFGADDNAVLGSCDRPLAVRIQAKDVGFCP